MPLDSVLTPAELDPDDEWTRVTVTGRYAGGPVFVRNRTLDGQAGLEVVWAFRRDAGGPDVVVDRGWVGASDQGASTLPSVPPAPEGAVEVTGWVRRGEAVAGPRDAAPSGGEPQRAGGRRRPRVRLGAPRLRAAREREVEPTARPRSARLHSSPPDRSLGPHLAYAYQWWLTTVLGFALVWFGIRRELRAEDPQRYPARPKKTRIWDEEDE